ncbi:MAG: uroporphyrinogen decarboxylase family protein [Anaerolineae bacterium]
MWAQVLGFNLGDYFQDLESFLAARLEMALYRHECVDDDTYVSVRILLQRAFVPVLEDSLYGLPILYSADSTPWCEVKPVLHDPADLEDLPRVDFFESGLMPRVHRWYREARGIIGDLPVEVVFPDWRRGIFGQAVRLRGAEQFLLDMYDRPEFVHRLMRHLVDDRKSWEAQRRAFLGDHADKAYLTNDEIGSDILSPRMYEGFILPYEAELAQFYGGAYSWHSCSRTDTFIGLVKKIPGLQVFHVGPWTDVERAVAEMCPQVGVEICLNPEKVLQSSEAEMREQLSRLVALGRGQPATIRADCFDVHHDLATDLATVHRWAGLAREMTAQQHC